MSTGIPERKLPSWAACVFLNIDGGRGFAACQAMNRGLLSAPGKWGRTQMGSDGFNRILTGF